MSQCRDIESINKEFKLKKVQIEGLGEVTFKKSSRAKYIRLRVEPFKGVVVTVPTYLNYEFGINAVMGKYEWLSARLQEVNQKEKELQFAEDSFPMQLKFYSIEIRRTEEPTPKRKFKNGVAFLCIPDGWSFTSSDAQEFISESVNKVLRQEAKIYLTDRVQHFSAFHQLSIGKVTIRDTKTRWGSCSYQNNISLSLHLMKLPDHLIDYVVLHELAHTKEKNHQKPFWTLLEVLCNGNAKKWDKELKNYNHLILR